MEQQRRVIVIGGPNGAGKTTISRSLIGDTLGLSDFVNADVIAAGLSGFAPERAAFAAGRVMLARLRELAAAGESFAFESTLSSRTFAPWLRGLVGSGWRVHLSYVWLSRPELAVRRVERRVRRGGHSIPVDVIRRRYFRSAANLFELYLPLARSWAIYDNSGPGASIIAELRPARSSNPIIHDAAAYSALKGAAENASEED
ncbi:MAG TPA: AAA family ATPase [Phycisphaerales bacterium]|nr:AAA family ATPase [Phycisphaerales bacterium]